MSNVLSKARELNAARIGVAVIHSGVSNQVPRTISSGSDLAWKFFGLGKLTGKTASEIIADVGMPTFRRAMPNGHRLLQWQAPGYHMALLFNPEDRAVKITSESAQFTPRCRAQWITDTHHRGDSI